MSTEKLKKIEDSFSERLRMLRRERGWSQEDLAARLDVSPGSVGNWEMGPYLPHPRTLKKIAGLFEVDVFFLEQGEHERGSRQATMREKPAEYGALDLAELLREIEGARDSLDRIAQQLRKASVKPSAAQGLVERASDSYDERKRKA
jgi:putative transcriptional regulator